MSGRTPAQVPARQVREAGPLLDRLTNLARGCERYARWADSMFTPATDRWTYRDIARKLGDELAEQIAALDVDQVRLLLALALDRVVAGETPAPPGGVPAATAPPAPGKAVT